MARIVLERLPARDRRILELRAEGLDHDAIARRLGITPAAARQAFHRATQRARDELHALCQ